MLLAYYIAAINIESVFHDVYAASGGSPSSATAYHPFDGIVLTDTFQLGEEGAALPGIFPENSERARKQKKLDIRVIVSRRLTI